MVIAFVLVASVLCAQGTQKSANCAQENEQKIGPQWVGWLWLSLEYVAGPIIASRYWWRHAFGQNPFKNIRDQEPYLEDKLWHLWNGENLTDFHHWVLRRYFGKDCELCAMGMTFLTLSAIEILDASDGENRWGLSLWDEAFNVGGIALWYVKKHYSVPLDVRVGIRRWDRLDVFARRIADFPKVFTDNVPQPPPGKSTHTDNYSILKVEVVVRPYSYFYVGFSSSLATDPAGWGIAENLFGVTAGFDVLRWYANKKPGKLTPYVNSFGRYFCLSPEYTFWFEGR